MGKTLYGKKSLKWLHVGKQSKRDSKKAGENLTKYQQGKTIHVH